MYSHDHDNEIIVFAETNFRNTKQKFGIKTDDRRRHTYILGKSGTGKTTLIENMILEDIYAGHGVAFVDPHGDSSEKILDYIPPHRVNDIVYFNPADVDFPIGFNVLEAVDTTHKHLIASGLMSVFKKIWEDMWSARMEYILNNAILALLDYPGSTLLGINRLLSDKEYRNKVISQSKDPVVKAFWVKEFAGYQQKFASEAVAPIQNKVGQFLSASIIRNIVAQVKSTIDIRKIMDEGKIFIMNLAKGRIGEDTSRLLGGMLITKIQLSAMERVDIPEKERLDFYLYVDEFQNFATGSFSEILSEARKYRLNLILAHQYIMQLDEKVRDAVFGNVGTHIVFRVGAADAAAFEEEFAPIFVPEDLVNLANYDVYMKLMINGAASQPFSAHTLPPIGSPTGSKDKVIKVSRERYSEKREIIEEKVERWWGFGEDSAPPPFQGGVRGGGSERGDFSSDRPRPSSSYSPSSPSSFPRRRESSDFSSSPFSKGGSAPVRGGDGGFSSPPPARGGVRGGGSNYDSDNRPSRFSSPPLETRGGRGSYDSDSRPPSYDTSRATATEKHFPALCSRCGKNTTSKFDPDPSKPFYCEDCLPIMREKIRLQSSSPPPLKKEGRGGFSSPPPLQGGVRGGGSNYDSDNRPSSPPLETRGGRGSYDSDNRPPPPIFTPLNRPVGRAEGNLTGQAATPQDATVSSPGLSLSALAPRPAKKEKSETKLPPPLEKESPHLPPSEKGDKGGFNNIRENPPFGRELMVERPPSAKSIPLKEGEKVEL